MSELPVAVESSLQIAWDYLQASDRISDPQQTAEFLLRSIRSRMLGGEERVLMLANRAIEEYQKQAIRRIA